MNRTTTATTKIWKGKKFFFLLFETSFFPRCYLQRVKLMEIKYNCFMNNGTGNVEMSVNDVENTPLSIINQSKKL